ncbi:preprotein translocase subunit SecD [Bradyrhizobium sp. GM6.1]
MLDGKVISAPIIREPITGGSGQISGNFTLEEANSVAMLLRAGSLPGHLGLVEQEVVPPAKP